MGGRPIPTHSEGKNSANKAEVSQTLKQMVCLLLACMLLAGCGKTEAPETQPETTQAALQETVDSTALRLTQESNVRKATYEGKTAYTDFLDMAKPLFLIPGLKQVLTPQGIASCPTTGRTYISAYSVDDLPSVVMVTEAQTNELVAEYYLYNPDGTPFTSHVGGVAVTETHMYLSAKLDNDGAYRIAAVALADLPGEGAHNITVGETIPMAMSPSMMNYSGGFLWVGNFYHPKADYNLSPNMSYTTPAADGSEYGCYILGFDMSQGHRRLITDGDYPLPDVILAAPNRIQGITLAGSNRVVLSQSYGRANDSALLIYELDLGGEADMTLTLNGQQIPAFLLDENRQTHQINAIPMSEGLTTGADGRVLVLFESGAIRYQDGKHRTSYVWALTLQ